MDSFQTENSNHLGKKKDYSPLKEANNSKVIQVELLLKDIKAAALKRARSYHGKENQNKVLGDSQDENIGNERRSLESTKPMINDPTGCLGQNGKACICEDLFDASDAKKKGLENDIKNEVSSFKDEKKDSSIRDNVTSKTIHSSESSENSSLQNTERSFVSQQITENDQKDLDRSERRENDQNESDPDHSERSENDQKDMDHSERRENDQNESDPNRSERRGNDQNESDLDHSVRSENDMKDLDHSEKRDNDQKDPDHSERSENDQKDPDHSERRENDISNQKRLLINNDDSSEIKSSESHIENGEDSILLNGTTETEISLNLSKTTKNDSEREQTISTSMKEFVKLKVIQDIIQEDKKLMDFTEESILSGNIAIKKPDHIEITTDKDPVDSENDDKDNSPNFTSSISEEEETLEEGICIIINGKRLPPASESELENLRNSNEKISTISKDGIDPDQSSSSVFESIEGTIDVTDSIDYSASVSDQGSTSRENSISQSQSSTKTDILTAILDMTSKTKLGKFKSSKMPDPPMVSENHLRPIIHNFLGDSIQTPVRTQSLNIKSVRFSQDTVFNEDKTKRYRKERASLRNIYRNRITGAEAYGKINPLYEDDSDEGEGYATKGQLPLERRGSFIYHGDDETSSNENTEGDSSIEEAVLNFPAYMQRFLQNESDSTTAIAKLNNSENKDIQGSSGNQKSENVSSSSKCNGKFHNAETPTIKITSPDRDVNHVGPLVPGYDVLIKKTIAKQQHHYFVKCSLGILFVLGLLAIVTIIVYFLIIKRMFRVNKICPTLEESGYHNH